MIDVNSVLFLGKKDDAHCANALDFVRRRCPDTLAFLGEWGDPLPEDIGYWSGDLIVSYLSRWVVPEFLLDKAAVAAINFHPAPPEYPGIGCTNFALYDEAKEYGVTCHHMRPTVDSGELIAVTRFPIFGTDDVESLLQRTYGFQLALFYEILGRIFAGRELPSCAERWSRRPTTRRDLRDLATITADMSDREVRRRVRATSYQGFEPTIEVGDYVFRLSGRAEERPRQLARAPGPRALAR